MTNDEYAKKYGAQLKAAAYEWRKKEKEKTWEKKAAEERKKKEAEERRKKEAEAAAAARKQKEAESSKRTWFQKGAFEDGYQFGDVTRTVIGTGMDVAEELEEGILEMGETAIDAGAYLVGGIGGFFGAEDFQNRTADFIKKDLYNSEEIIKRGNEYNPFSLALKAMGTDTESASLLGDRSESLVNSAGQLAAQYGLTMVGVPWFVTSSVTNFGGEVESSLNQGASYGEAGMSAAISTGAEILTEKLFGGDLFTKSGGFDAAVDALTKNISHKFVQKATKFGLNALGEGAEEWLSTRIGQFGQWLSYQRKRDEKGLFQMLYSEEAIDEAIESFFGGTILGFGQGGVKTGSQRNSSTQDSQADAQSGETAADKSAEVQAKSGTEGSQTAMDAFEEALKLGSNAPADPVGAAVDGFRQTGVVTNKQAADILMDSKAVAALQAQGLDLKNATTASARREAIKNAVAALAQKQAETTGSAEMIAPTIGSADASLSNMDAESITVDMTDEQRYAALSGKVIKPVADVNSANYTEDMTAIKALPAKAKSKVEKIIKPLAEKLGILNRSLKTPDIDINFQFTKKGLSESLSKQLRYGGSYADFAGAIGNLEEILNNAVLIEQHTDKYTGTSRANRNLESVYVLFGAYQDGTSVIPVQMEIKKSSDVGGRLYVTVAMTKIEADVLGSAVGHRQAHSLIPASEYSLADIFKKINPADKHFLKYLPDAFLSEAQQKAKQEALKEDADKIAGYKNNARSSISDNRAATPTESVGAAPEGFTGKQGYYDQLTDENSQPDRPGDVRPMEVLKTDRNGRRVTEFAANAYGAEVTSDRMADRIQELIDKGKLGFDTRSNPESIKRALNDIRKNGDEAVRSSITANVDNGRLQDGDIEKAMLLYTYYANQDTQASLDLASNMFVNLATMANMSGRNLQLFQMLRKMSPEGQMLTIQKSIDRYMKQLNKKRSDKNQAQVEIPQELADAYIEAARKDLDEQTAETEKEKAKIEQEIYKVAASQIKASFVEKLNAWRYMAMLGNVKTQTRNVAGNLTFRPLVNVKRTVGAAIESVTLEKSQRTKSVLGVGAEAKALRQWAREDAKGMDAKKLLSYTARTGDSAKSQIEDARAIYDNKALEATREFIQKVPEAADMVFKRWEYEVSLASFLKARGYTTADITGGKVSEDILNEAREYAALEAMKATFNDRNTVSDALVNLRYKGDSKALKALNILAEGVMPFRRTPANIAVRAVEYSPVNIARGALNLATKVRNGNMSAATAIDQISSGLTGTGAMVLGYALASGIFGFKLKGHLDDEDEKNAGHQAYALEIGGKSYSINWLAPTNIPLFIGANIYQNSQEDAQDVSWFANFANASVNALEPMLELSCMSSLQDWIEDMKYAQSGTEIYTAISSAATNYMSQYIPTLFGQVERAVEGEKKQVYADGDTPLERSIQKTIGYATQKLPGDAFQTQKYDQWGNPVEKDNWFDALINPSSVKEISTDPLDAEVSRLNGAQGKYNVTANKPSQTVSYTDADGVKHEKERLTGEQWEKLQAVYGQTSYKVMSGMIQSEDYTALPDERKAKAFDLAYEYATELGREQALKGQYTRDLPKWMEGLDGAGQDVADAILRYVWTGTTSKYTELSMQDAANVVEVLETLLAESGYTNVRGVQKVEAIVAADDFLTEKEQTEVLKDTLDDKAWDKYQQILKLGLDNDDYAASYRLYLDTTGSGKKERTIKAFQKELGVSYNTAKALYEIYNPSKKAAS